MEKTITDIVGEEILDLIGVLGTLTDEELEELLMCTRTGQMGVA
tara:strand:+ start:142 stop:273 length:132 start_codon:yes stop_codon:yes gene_type:complete